MKYSWFISAFLLLGLRAEAQTDSVGIGEVFKSKRHWELSLNHGFVRPTITPEFGPEKAYAINGRVFDLGLGYTFNASEKLGFTATGKAGAYPITLGIPPTAYSYGIDSKQYFLYASYTVFAELAATANYRHDLSNKFALVPGAGFGVKFIAPTSVGSGFSGAGTQSQSKFYIKNNGEGKPFLLLQTTLQYKLKNSDLLGLRLSYHHSLKPVQEGSYFIASNSPAYSYGKVEVKGQQLSLGLVYTFTGYEKLQRRMAEETPNNRHELKQAVKRAYYENRLDKGTSVRVYGGIFVDRSTSTDETGTIGNIGAESLGIGLDFSRNFGKHYFWEAGLNKHEYYHGNSVHYADLLRIGSYSNAFEAVQVSAGLGYMLRRKNLVPWFYVSAGAAVGYTYDDNTGLAGGSGGGISNPANGNFVEYNADNYLLRKMFPLIYTGIRKDFRIRGKLFFSPEFKYYQGLVKIYESRLRYTTNLISPEMRNTTVFMRGSYFQYSLGLKLDL